jgi:hypothetical protein
VVQNGGYARICFTGIIAAVLSLSYTARRRNIPGARFLEQKLQPELNQPGVCPQSGAGYYPEILIVGGAADGVGRSKLSAVEDIEKLRAEFYAKPLVAGKSGSLE